MLPQGFIDHINQLSTLKGGDVLIGLPEALSSTDQVVGVRRNCRKTRGFAPEGGAPIPWLQDLGITIDGERPRFTLDPALHQGRYYVQDPSSMITAAVVNYLTKILGRKDIVYLDGCAAPGGKTTAAIDALNEDALIIANEYERKRALALTENLAKWGANNVVVLNDDARRFSRMGEFADIIAADVPCSGEGMMRKDPDAVAQWSESLIKDCSALQREIVKSLWQALKPGGFLIYSTCTFNRAENEENVEWIITELGAEPVEMPRVAPEIAGTIGSDIPAMRFIPGRVNGEGLFMAVLRKPGEWQPSDYSSKSPKLPKELHGVDRWLSEPEKYQLATDKNSDAIAVPARYSQLINRLNSKLNVIQSGVNIATLKGKSYRPTQQYVLSSHCRAVADGAPFVAVVEVDYPTAISYLRGESLIIDAPRGWVLLTYAGYPLGIVNNLGNRANNVYPDSWAIRTTHIPESFTPLVI